MGLHCGVNMAVAVADSRDKGLQDYRKKLLEHKEIDGRLKELREQLREQNKLYEKSENDLKALQSVGQIVGEVLKQLTEEKFIVKATNGPRYVVGCRRQLDKGKLKPGTRVALDMTTLTIMRYLPREVDPLVYNMSHEDPGDVTYNQIGGLGEQIRELREGIELPLLNPELFLRVGITPPKVVFSMVLQAQGKHFWQELWPHSLTAISLRLYLVLLLTSISERVLV